MKKPVDGKRLTVVISTALLKRLEVVRDGRSYQAVFDRAVDAWIEAQKASA